MTVLGCGGAATAICTQAALDGVSDIDIFQLKLPEEFDRALAFADRVREHTSCNIHIYDLQTLNRCARAFPKVPF